MEQMNKSLSDSEFELPQQKTPQNFITTRTGKKRREEDYSARADFAGLKDEMKKMFATFITSQNNEFQKYTNILKEIQKSNQNIENSISFLTSQNKELQEKICKLEVQVKEDRKYINILEDKIEDLQKEKRKNNIEIKNAPKKPSETKEDLIDMVISLSKHVTCDIEKSEIKDIYRVRGKKEDTQNTPIVIEISSTIRKNDFLRVCKAYNNRNKTKLCARHLGHRYSDDTPIYVSEQLTAKTARLFFLARDLVKSYSYKFCWTSYGKVYVRKEENSKIILITNEAQIQQLTKV